MDKGYDGVCIHVYYIIQGEYVDSNSSVNNFFLICCSTRVISGDLPEKEKSWQN
jgi:hypothetical protein